MEDASRLSDARRRLRSARLGIGVVTGVAFAALVLAARAAHPGASAHASTGTPAASADDTQSSSSSFFDDGGSSSFGSTQSPGAQLQSGGS